MARVKVYLVYLDDPNGILSQILGIADSIEGVQKIASKDIVRPELCTDEYEMNERVKLAIGIDYGDDPECKYEASSSDPLALKCTVESHNHRYLSGQKIR